MSWRRVLGHEVAIALFASAWKRGRLGHAYLLIGPHGVGKHTFAIELAKTVLCENRRDQFEACDQCGNCHLVDAGTHPDLFMVKRPEEVLEFPIRVIREELLPNLALKPARSSRKVAILDDADDLNEEAANAFLKTLEEPPPGSLLLLVGGSNAERQLPTILSRCQVIRFAPPPPALATRILTENGVTDPVRAQRLLQLAAGSPGEALTLDDDEVWKFRGSLLETLQRGRFAPDQLVRPWMEFIENAGKESSAQRGRASLIVRMMVLMLETALKLSLGTAPPGLDAAEEKSLRTLAANLGEEKLLAWIERALIADRQIEYRVQLILIIEALVDALCR